MPRQIQKMIQKESADKPLINDVNLFFSAANSSNGSCSSSGRNSGAPGHPFPIVSRPEPNLDLSFSKKTI